MLSFVVDEVVLTQQSSLVPPILLAALHAHATQATVERRHLALARRLGLELAHVSSCDSLLLTASCNMSCKCSGCSRVLV
jgi:hypothetical protein